MTQAEEKRIHAGVLDVAYQESLEQLITNLRRDIGAPEMNVVIGRISDHSPGADVLMADLGIAHLPFRQADMVAAGVDQRPRRRRQQTVRDRGRRACDGIVLGVFGLAPTIQNAEHDRLRAARVNCVQRPFSSAPQAFGETPQASERQGKSVAGEGTQGAEGKVKR